MSSSDCVCKSISAGPRCVPPTVYPKDCFQGFHYNPNNPLANPDGCVSDRFRILPKASPMVSKDPQDHPPYCTCNKQPVIGVL